MLNGTFAGGIVGLVVAVFGLGLASLFGPAPQGADPPQPPAAIPPDDVADLPEAPREPGDAPVQPSMPQIGAPATAPAHQVPEPEVAAVPAADTAPAVVPRTEAITGRPAVPEPTPVPDLPTGAETPVLPNPQAMAPSQPSDEADVIVSTDPGTPAADPPPAEIVVEADPDAAGPSPEAEGAPGLAGDRNPPAAPADDGDLGTQIARPAPAREPEGATVAAAADSADGPNPAAEDDEEDVRIVQRGVGDALPSGAEAVVINRAVPEDAAEAAPADTPDAAPAGAADSDVPPLERYAADFENPENLPLLAVILIDDGSLEDAATAVAAIGIPLTVAIDPARPDAREAMAAYRERGIEVAVLPRLPDGAQAADVEVTLEAALSEIPQAVALVDATGAWQSGGGVAEQALARLGAEGRGFVTISSGLNAGLRAAAAEDVPAAVVYRDLDADRQDARVIRRFVDQAAFRARQSSGVVLLGRVRAETISALTLWSTANRAGQVALAPLSAVLRAAGA